MTGDEDPWQPPAPRPAPRRPKGPHIPDTRREELFHLIHDAVMMQPASYTHAVVDAIIGAGWRPPEDK